ncbi:MAG TPA: matrixin family metalloprotease, partial [Actinomycetes bacterium]
MALIIGLTATGAAAASASASSGQRPGHPAAAKPSSRSTTSTPAALRREPTVIVRIAPATARSRLQQLLRGEALAGQQAANTGSGTSTSAATTAGTASLADLRLRLKAALRAQQRANAAAYAAALAAQQQASDVSTEMGPLSSQNSAAASTATDAVSASATQTDQDAQQQAAAAAQAEADARIQEALQALARALSTNQCTTVGGTDGQPATVSCPVDGGNGTITGGQGLDAAAAPDAPVQGGDLSAADLDAALDSARQDWLAVDPDADLSGVHAAIEDLPGLQLGEESGGDIVLDTDAAGWGWGPDGMDLATVVRHELGHVLGLGHTDGGLMNDTLAAGQTKTVESAPTPPAADDSTGSTGSTGSTDDSTATDATSSDSTSGDATTSDATTSDATTGDATTGDATTTAAGDASTATTTDPAPAAVTASGGTTTVTGDGTGATLRYADGALVLVAADGSTLTVPLDGGDVVVELAARTVDLVGGPTGLTLGPDPRHPGHLLVTGLAGVASLSFLSPTQAAVVTAAGGSVTLGGAVHLGGADLQVNAQHVTVGPGADVDTTGTDRSGAIVLHASDTAGSSDGSAADVTVTGASLTGASIDLGASATTTRSATGSNAAVSGSAAASVTVLDSHLTATGDVALHTDAAVSATARATGDSAHSDAAIDAAVATVAISSYATTRLGGASAVDAGGALSVSAHNHTDVVASADASTSGAGAGIATAVIDRTTRATLDSSAADGVSAGSLSVSADADGTLSVTSGSSHGGASHNDVDPSLRTNGTAITATGPVTVASALSFGRVHGVTQAILSGALAALIARTAQAALLARTNDTSGVSADASSVTTPGADGTAVAVADTDLVTTATLNGDLDVSTPSLVVQALLPTASSVATATGGSTGAVAVNRSRLDTSATLTPGSVLTLSPGGDVALQSGTVAAHSATSSSAGSAPAFAVLVADTATRSTVADGVSVVGARDVTLAADGTDSSATSVAGNGPGYAVTLATVTTSATVGSGTVLVVSGDLALAAHQTASGDTHGSAVAVTVGRHSVTASSARSLTAGGAVTVSATGTSRSVSVAPGSSLLVPVSAASALTGLADQLAALTGAHGTSGIATGTPTAPVHAVALTAVDATTTAALAAGLPVHGGGPVDVPARQNVTATATAGTGDAPSGTATAFAAVVGDTTVQALADAPVAAGGQITVHAGRGPPADEISATVPDQSSTSLQLLTSTTRTTTPQVPAFVPPAGAVLVTAALGGTVTSGPLTLTFAPGALPEDAWVLVTARPGGIPGNPSLATSAVYDLTAYAASTGTPIEHFATAPRLTLAVGPDAGASSIYYLDPAAGLQAIASTVDAAAGTVSADLPHFSAYVALRDTLVQVIVAALDAYVAGTPLTLPNGDLDLGVLHLQDPTVTVPGSVQITSPGQFTGVVTFTSGPASIDLTVGGQHLTLTAATVSGTYTVAGAPDSGTFSLTLTGVALDLAGLVEVTAPTLTVSVGDVAGAVTTSVTATGVAATLGGPATGGVAVSLTNAALSFTVAQPASDPVVTLDVTGGTMALTGVPGVTLTAGTGTAVAVHYASATSTATAGGSVLLDVTGLGRITADLAVSGDAAGRLHVTAAGGSLFLGTHGVDAAHDSGLSVTALTLALEVRPDGSYALRASGLPQLVNLTSAVTLSGTAVAEANTTGEQVALGGAVLAAGVRRVQTTGVTVTVAGLATVTGDLTAELSSSNGGELLLGVGNGSLTVAAGSVQLAVTGLDALLVVRPDLTWAVQASGNATLTGVPGLTLAGALSVSRSTITGATRVTRDVLVGGVRHVLDVAAATGATAVTDIAGQALTLGMQAAGAALQGPVSFALLANGFTVGVTGGSLSLAGGRVTATDLSMSAAATTSGLSLSGSATAVTVALPGVALTGPVTVAFDTAGPTATLQVGTVATAASLTVLGQTLHGRLSLHVASGDVAVSVDALSLDLTGVVATAADGSALSIGSGGITGSFAATATGALLGGTGLAGTLHLDTAAGLLEVSVTVTNLAIGTGSVTGSVAFRRSQVAGQLPVTVLAVSGLTVSLGGTSILTGGTGAFVLGATSGVAGYVSGTATADSGTGFTAGGTALLRVNTTGQAVHQSIVVGGQQVAVDFADGTSTFALSLTGASLTIGNLVTVKGDVAFAGDGTFAGRNLTVFVGDGPAFLPDGSVNPVARGLLVTNATVGVVRTGSGPDFGYAVEIHGSVALLGVPAVVLSGTLTARVNTTGATVTKSIPVAGGPDVTVTFGAGEGDTPGSTFTDVHGDDLTLTVAGRDLVGALAFTKGAGSFTVTATHLHTAFTAPGSATPFLSLTEGTATLTASATGVTGSFTAGVALALPGVGLSASSLTVAVDSAAASPITASATGITVTVAGQDVTNLGVTFARTVTGGVPVTTLTLTGGAISLASGGSTYLSVTGVTGSLTVGAAGTSGHLGATIASA